jgi:hypothetical protein
MANKARTRPKQKSRNREARGDGPLASSAAFLRRHWPGRGAIAVATRGLHNRISIVQLTKMECPSLYEIKSLVGA